MLVQIENGQANPSIATLCKVAAALGASVADLVQASGEHPAEVLPAGAPRLLWRGPKGGSATLLVGSAGPDTLGRWGGGGGAGGRHEGEAPPPRPPERSYVVRGRVLVAVGGVRYLVASGGGA